MENFVDSLKSLITDTPIGSSIVSSGIGHLNQSLSAKRNAEIEYSNWLKKFNYQYEMNSPKNMVRRLQEAGLNPALMYQGGTGGSLSTSISQAPIPTSPVDPLSLQHIINETKVADAEANLKNSQAAGQNRTNWENIETWSMRRTILEVDSYLKEEERKFWDATYETKITMLSNESSILAQSLKKVTQEATEAEARSTRLVTVQIGDNTYQIPYYQAEMIRNIELLTEQIESLMSGQALDKASALNQAALADYHLNKPIVEQWELWLKQQDINVDQYNAWTERLKTKFSIKQFEENLKFGIHQFNEAQRLQSHKMKLAAIQFMAMVCTMGAAAMSSSAGAAAAGGAVVGTSINPYDNGSVVFAD